MTSMKTVLASRFHVPLDENTVIFAAAVPVTSSRRAIGMPPAVDPSCSLGRRFVVSTVIDPDGPV
jgi:hypothetical protein